jgi:DNA repair protein RadA/Sms
MGSCPSCAAWNSFEEHVIDTGATAKEKSHRAKTGSDAAVKPIKLEDIEVDADVREKTGITEFDRVLGGGAVKGSLVLLGGDPGIGKSTLTLQLARENPHKNILYVSGEESAPQIHQRAKRLGVDSKNLRIYTETDMNSITAQVEALKPDWLIIDSIQTVYRPELQSMPGSVVQVRESASLLQRLCKSKQITTILVGHITKGGDLAGPRVLEHMVDTVLMFEGQEHYNYRMLRSLKNRFGSTFEMGVFEMTQTGLQSIDNPSELFLPAYDEAQSGSTICCSMEGSRPLLLEVQALVSASSYGTPQRNTTGIDSKRLNLLLAVLEKRCGYKMGDKDVFVNLAGGLKITEPSIDLAVCLALVSASVDRALPRSVLAIGEVGLGAEIRGVQFIEKRVEEATKMGFKTVIIPEKSPKIERKDCEIVRVRNIREALSNMNGRSD